MLTVTLPQHLQRALFFSSVLSSHYIHSTVEVDGAVDTVCVKIHSHLKYFWYITYLPISTELVKIIQLPPHMTQTV